MQLQQRIAQAKAAPPSGMSQSTLTVEKSSVMRKLMRTFADELTQVEARQLRTSFAEMVFATNLPHSWVQHVAVQKFFKALRPAFQLPTRHELSTPLLLGVYAAIAKKVQSELKKHVWLTVTSDGWSRQQGSEGHAALALPGAYAHHHSFNPSWVLKSALALHLMSLQDAGVEPLSDDEEDVLQSNGGESGQENVTPASDAIDAAVAAEEAFMEMTATGPYHAVL